MPQQRPSTQRQSAGTQGPRIYVGSSSTPTQVPRGGNPDIERTSEYTPRIAFDQWPCNLAGAIDEEPCHRRTKSGLATCRPTRGVICYRRALLLGQDHEIHRSFDISVPPNEHCHLRMKAWDLSKRKWIQQFVNSAAGLASRPAQGAARCDRQYTSSRGSRSTSAATSSPRPH